MKTRSWALLAKMSVFFVFCGVIVFSGFQVFAQEWIEQQKEVWKGIEDSWEKMTQGDAEGLTNPANVHENSLTWWAMAPVPFDVETRKARWTAWFQQDKIVSYDLKPLNISIIGDVAIAYHLSKYKTQGGYSDEVRQMFVIMKEDGKWKFIGSLGASCGNLPRCTAW